MVTALSNWTSLLQTLAASEPSTSAKLWICEMGDEEWDREIKTFTPEQYEATHNDGRSTWRKLSLKEIMDVSHRSLDGAKKTALFEIRTFTFDCTVDEEFEGAIKKKIVELKTDHLAKKLLESLQALVSRYVTKHTPQEISEIHHHFNALLKLGTNDVPVLRKEVCEVIQERITLNMEWFEEAVRHQETEEYPSSVRLSKRALQERFATPHDVESKWIAYFGVDSGNTFTADPIQVGLASKSRSRISALVQIWKNFLQFEVPL